MNETLTVLEVARILRCHPNTIYARVNDRSRRDAFPIDAIDKSQHGIRIHASVLPRPVGPTPIRPADLPYGREDSEDRVARLVAKIRELQVQNLELSTALLKAEQELDLLRIERRIA